MTSSRVGKATADSITAFPDTNIFLHFLPFDQVSWPKELKAQTVRLHVTAVVVRELTKHRDKHPVEHIRERARTTLRKIREIVLNGNGTVKDGVVLYCDSELAGFDMTAHGLDPTSQDDCILAAILAHKERHVEERVVLVTDDDPFAVHAHTKSVVAVALRDSLRILPEPDPKQKEILELKGKLRAVEQGLPKLSISLPDGKSYCELALVPDVMVTEQDAQNFVASQVAPLEQSAERWRALASKQEGTKSQNLPEGAAAWADLMSTFADMMAEKASLDRETHFRQCVRYFLAWWKHRNDMQRTKELRLVLANTGTVPADEINIFVRVPKGVDVSPAGGLPPMPSLPLPPGKKRGPAPVGKTSGSVTQSCSIRYMRVVEFPDCWELQYQLPRLNHHVTEVLTGLYIRFPSYVAAMPLTIEYRLAALNMPDSVRGTIQVIPTRADVQTKHIGRKSRSKR
jgi:rRNA-processing protein FCF1